MPTVIQARNLSKRYRIGRKADRRDTLTGQLLHGLLAPVRNFRQLRGLSRFGEREDNTFWALKDVSFSLEQGEVLGIIGANGSGKSTLLKILGRITEPTSGEIRVRGRVSTLLEVGTGFHPELSGRENVYLNGAILGMTRREIGGKFDQIVDFSGVEQFIDTPVKFYSSGMKVRLGFSVAAHLEPEVLLIDEVLAVGDAEFQEKCIRKMEAVSHREGRTIIFVSHYLGIMPGFCSRGIWLHQGQVARAGDMQAVIQAYRQHLRSSQEFSRLLESVEARQEEGGIVLECRYQSEEVLDFPYFGFVLSDYKGEPIFASNPTVEGIDTRIGPLNTRKGRVRITIRSPRLIDGIYRIAIWFGDSQGNFIESSHGANLVIEGMTPGRKLPAATGGHVLPHCEWEFWPGD